MVASDVSSNYTLYSDFNSQNGGTGFGAWSISNNDPAANDAGDFVNTAADGGFDIWENGAQAGGAVTDTIAAIRPFSGALGSGQVLSFFDYLNAGSNTGNSGPGGGPGPGCSLGFSLEDSAGNALFTLAAHGGGGYTLTDATQTNVAATGMGYNYQSIDNFSFLLNDAATGAYTLTVSGAASETYTGFISTATGGISQLAVFNTNGGYGSDLRFDNLSISNTPGVAPEPASLGLLGIAAGAGLLRRRRSALD